MYKMETVKMQIQFKGSKVQGSKFKYNSESSFKATPPIRHSEPLVGEESTKEEVGGW
jgi:hypothetical protein